MIVAFIAHGARRRAREAVTFFRSNPMPGMTFDFYFTEHKGHGTELALSLASRCDMLMVAGGDGLLSECVNGLVAGKGENEKIPVLAFIPCGSGNDFARNFKWTSQSGDMMERLKHMQLRPTDLGVIDSNGKKEYFINEASFGMSTEVVKQVNRFPARWSGNLKFGLSILKVFITYRKSGLILQGKNFDWKGKSMVAVFANGAYFGSGVGIAPQALTDDGELDITVVGDVSLLDYLRFLPKLRRRERIDHVEVKYFRTTEVSIQGNGNMERDGELSEELPLTISIQKQRLVFLV